MIKDCRKKYNLCSFFCAVGATITVGFVAIFLASRERQRPERNFQCKKTPVADAPVLATPVKIF